MQRDTTILIAHPDDEALFLWPFLDSAKTIIACVSDRDNAERPWCNKRAEALQEVCELLKCECFNLEMNSGFYRAKRAGLEAIADKIGVALEMTEGPIATHNHWGEYGHLDHVICHSVAASFAPSRIVMSTDTVIQRDWLPMPRRTIVQRTIQAIAAPERDRFEAIKAIYLKHNCWTWDGEGISDCHIIEY